MWADTVPFIADPLAYDVFVARALHPLACCPRVLVLVLVPLTIVAFFLLIGFGGVEMACTKRGEFLGLERIV